MMNETDRVRRDPKHVPTKEESKSEVEFLLKEPVGKEQRYSGG